MTLGIRLERIAYPIHSGMGVKSKCTGNSRAGQRACQQPVSANARGLRPPSASSKT